MSKTINTILNLEDRFTNKLDAAGKKALIFKTRLKSCEEAAQKADKFLSKMAQTAVAAGTAAVAAMTKLASACVKTYGEFQQSMSNVAGILSIDASSESYARLEAAAREAGRSTTKTAAESADALSYMALAGWSVEDSINGLMPILRASEATGADLATTSDLITDSMSAMGLRVSQLEEYLDMAAKANNKSNLTMQELLETITGAGGAARAAGVDMYDLSTAAGILGDNGTKGAEAGTALNAMLVRMTSHEAALNTMKALGVSVFDASGGFRGLESILTDLNRAMNGMSTDELAANLKKIAGTNYYSQFKYLLDAMNSGSAYSEEFTNRWSELSTQLHSSAGALDAVADTMTNNYAGALARAGSAMDELKITIGQKLEPYITQLLNWFSEKLPASVEKLSLWLDNRIPKAIEFCRNAFDKLKTAAGFVAANFSKFAAIAAGVVVGLKAFSIITGVVSLIKSLESAERALRAAQLLLNTSILACPVTWIAAAIGAVTGGVLLYKNAVESAERADLAAHFGDVALSAEECGKLVENVFGSRLIQQTEELNGAWTRVENHFKSLSASATALNELTFQFRLNPENVSEDEYLEAAQQYVDDMQEAISGKQYELALDIGFLFGEGSEAAEAISGQTNKYWLQVLANAQELGAELVAGIKEGYENGWSEASIEMAAEGLQKMSEIQERIQKAQAQGQMELLTVNFTKGDLTQESFQAYVDSLQEQGRGITDAAKTAAANALAAQKLMLEDEAVTPEQYELNVEGIKTAYSKKTAEALNTVLKEALGAVQEAFPKEFERLAKQLNEDLAGEFAVDPENLEDSGLVLQDVLTKSMENAEISSGVKKALQGYIEELMPMAEELGREAAKDETLKTAYEGTLTSVEALKTLTDTGGQFGEALISGINSEGNLMNAEKASQELKNRAVKVFSERVAVTIPIEIKYGTSIGANAAYTSPEASTFAEASAKEQASREKKTENKKTSSYAASTGYGQLGAAMNRLSGNATGTPYFGGGLTRINEYGGEIINLPTGAQIIPSDKSEMMVKEAARVRNEDTPRFGGSLELKRLTAANAGAPEGRNGSVNKSFGDIHVNLNVGGSIVGIEDFADEIGGLVSEKLVQAIRVL